MPLTPPSSPGPAAGARGRLAQLPDEQRRAAAAGMVAQLMASLGMDTDGEEEDEEDAEDAVEKVEGGEGDEAAAPA